VRDPGGTITAFDAPDAGKSSGQGTGMFLYGINARVKITGYYIDASNVYHGFLRSKSGAILEFDAPGAGTGAGQGTAGIDINRDQDIAGWDQDDEGVYHGYLRTP